MDVQNGMWWGWVFIWLLSSAGVGGEIPESEKKALRAFYSALGGTGWYRNNGWRNLSNRTAYKGPCQDLQSWDGIESCNAEKTSVTGIVFSYENNLSGTIPGEFFEGLPNLSLLGIVQQASLSGSLPPEMFMAEKLQGVYIYQNPALSGTLPTDSVFENRSNRSQLEVVSLYGNSISGTIPAGLLCGNVAAGRLHALDVHENNFTGELPSSECLATPSNRQLQRLYVSGNQISGTIPPAMICGIASSENLEDFQIIENQISGTLPSSECLAGRSNRTSLFSFQAQKNRISGTLPEEFVCGNLAAQPMNSFQVQYNKLSGFLPSESCLSTRSQQSKLKQFLVFSNKISGTIPAGLICGNDAADILNDFEVQFNKISGTLPSNECLASRSRLSNLEYFYAYQNQISGTLPKGLLCGNIATETMTDFSVSDNRLSGTLPPNACLANRSNQTQLRRLYLYGNQISGTIPEALVCGTSASESMLDLELGANRLSGFVFSEECLAGRSSDSQLKHLYLYGNRLSGTIPSGLLCGSANPLTALQLEECQLSGEIPNCQGGSVTANENLEVVTLHSNNLQGTLPNMLWPGMKVLSISNNPNLEGSLDGLPNSLEYLVSQGCKLSGGLEKLGFLPNLTKAYLSGNKISGTIPHRMFHDRLTEVVLSHNLVSGSIPPKISQAGNLTKLLLDNNRIRGHLPGELAQLLPGLTDLRLQLNELSCEISASLYDWPSLPSANIQVVQGNMFGCRGIDKLRDADKSGYSYVCGNDGFTTPLVLAAVSVGIFLGLFLWWWMCGSTSLLVSFWSWWQGRRSVLQFAARNSVGVAAALGILGVIIPVVATPTFRASHSPFQCQYLNMLSLAFKSGATDPIEYTIGWIVSSLFFTSLGCVVALLWWTRLEPGKARFWKKYSMVKLEGGDQKKTATTERKTIAQLCHVDSKRKERRVQRGKKLYIEFEDGETENDKSSCRPPTCLLVLLEVFLIIVLIALLGSTNVVQVVVDISTTISSATKQLLLYINSTVSVLFSMYLVPIIADRIVHLISNGSDSRKNMALGLVVISFISTLNNLFIPGIADALAFDSCLKPKLVPLKPVSTSPIQTQICGSFLVNFQTGATTCLANVELDTGTFTPPFRIRPEYCLSTLIRVFAPFFISSLLANLLVHQLKIMVSIIWSEPPSWANFVFKSETKLMWPGLLLDCTAEEVTSLSNDLIQNMYCDQLTALGIMLTMGIAAPLVGLTTAFCTLGITFRYIHMLSAIHNTVSSIDEASDIPFQFSWIHSHGSLPIAATIIPCIGALIFWSVFGWGALNFGWPVGVYSVLLLLSTIGGSLYFLRGGGRWVKREEMKVPLEPSSAIM